MHQGGFYRFSYDITDLLKPGKKNLLEVKIAKESANKSINAAERKADWSLWWYYRPVWLGSCPGSPHATFCSTPISMELAKKWKEMPKDMNCLFPSVH